MREHVESLISVPHTLEVQGWLLLLLLFLRLGIKLRAFCMFVNCSALELQHQLKVSYYYLTCLFNKEGVFTLLRVEFLKNQIKLYSWPLFLLVIREHLGDDHSVGLKIFSPPYLWREQRKRSVVQDWGKPGQVLFPIWTFCVHMHITIPRIPLWQLP
jgi:hypothetical protein